MIVFALGMFPLLMIAVSLAGSADTKRNVRTVRESTDFKAVAFGLLSGIAVCAVKALFVFLPGGIIADFFARFWYALAEVAIPFIALAVVFFLLFLGEPRVKIASFFFLFSAYWTVLLPYHILSNVAPGFFEYCVVPFIYAAAAADTALLAARLYDALEKKHGIPFAFLALGCLPVFALPAAAEASRDSGGGAYMTVASVFFVYSAGILIFCRGKKRAPW
jgi:hypothetical protein